MRDAVNPTLTMNDYQAEVATTAIYKWPLIYPALGLANEAGEVLGKIKKLIRDNDVRFDQGNKELSAAQRITIAAEVGDVLWYAAAISRDLGISLNEVAQMNLDKLADRKARGVIGGSGDTR